MAYDETLRSVSLDADASLAVWTGVPGQPGSAASPNHGGKQYHFVTVTGNGIVGVAGASDDVIGVVQNKPQVVGEAATVAYLGISRVIAAKALSAGDKVTAAADGKATTGGANVVGIVITGTAAAGEVASVLLKTV